jgi:predicted helicase
MKNIISCAIKLKIITENILNEEINKSDDSILSENIGQLFAIYKTFKSNLIYDLNAKDFSDSFVQIIVFSAFFSKINANEGDTLTIKNIVYRFFYDFPLIKGLLVVINDLDNRYRELNKVIYELFAIFNCTQKIDNDNFYEIFLIAYDKTNKHDRGIFTTPQKLAEFIVREVDIILKNDFYCEDGLGDSRIKTLDFACGTGTFLNEVYKKTNIDNVYGFELMMAPYMIANFMSKKRGNIFLTNTLENNTKVKFSSIPEITNEAKKAQTIKDKNICVILGNPPFNIKTNNKNSYIDGLMRDYLISSHDDYVKFIRFAENKISKSPFGGVFSAVLNHGFIDNPSFIGMRKHLFNTFDDMYFIDLNGNFRRQKFTVDGVKDKNLFPIKQGICIVFFIKYPEEISEKRIFYREIVGNTQSKIEDLMKIGLQDKTKWFLVKSMAPFFSFKPSNESLRKEYDKGVIITDIFTDYGGGVTTSRDDFVMNISREKLLEKFINFRDSDRHDNLYDKFNVAKKIGWDILKVWDKFQNFSNLDIEKLIKPIHFRGFDVRYILYDKSVIQNISPISQHLIDKNIGICFAGREIDTINYSSIFVTDKILSSAMHYYGAKLAPMYINGVPNFKPQFLEFLQKKYTTNFSTEQIFAYIYGSFNINNYRTKYATFLSIDYPKIYFYDDFLSISNFGQELIDAHLLKNQYKSDISFVGQDFIVKKVIHLNDKLYINESSYFAGITEQIYGFKIGCYPILEKWLKPRKNLDICNDIEYVVLVANAIKFCC